MLALARTGGRAIVALAAAPVAAVAVGACSSQSSSRPGSRSDRVAVCVRYMLETGRTRSPLDQCDVSATGNAIAADAEGLQTTCTTAGAHAFDCDVTGGPHLTRGGLLGDYAATLTGTQVSVRRS